MPKTRKYMCIKYLLLYLPTTVLEKIVILVYYYSPLLRNQTKEDRFVQRMQNKSLPAIRYKYLQMRTER